jgi:hypothetical protein
MMTLIKLKAELTTSLVPVVISKEILLKIVSNCSEFISSRKIK